MKINITEFNDFQYLNLLMGCSIQKQKPQTESLTLPTFPNYPDMDFEDFTVSWSKKKLTTSATNIELKSTHLFQLNKNPIILRRKK